MAATVVAAVAADTNSNSSYPRMDAAMTKFGYDWEAITVTTEDDYILTTYHITNKTGSASIAT